MARFQCKCGNVLSNSLVPNEMEYHVFSDVEWDRIMAKDQVNTWELPEPRYPVWKCNSCNRFHVFNKQGERIATYIIEVDY